MSVTVLLADDHRLVREGLQVLLESHADIKVVGHAADGREAIQQASKLCPDVMLLDIAMPGMNGIDVTSQIRSLCPSTRVIILSMHATHEHLDRALQAGAHGYVLKESAGAEVVSAIRSVSQGHHYLSPRLSDLVVKSYVSGEGHLELDSPLSRLSAREREVLQLVVEGNSSSEIAGLLHLSAKSVETYRSRLMSKLNIDNLPALVKFAIAHGVTSV